MAKSNAVALDFTNVKESGGKFRTTRQEAGDYKAKVMDVETVPIKDSKEKQWCFVIKAGSGVYPYYCQFSENTLWKIRNLFVAAGINVPKKRVKVDPNRVVGKTIGVTLEDDEYDGKKKSTIASVFPASELEDNDTSDDDEDEDEDTEDTETEDSDEEETSDDTDDEDEEEEPEPPKKAKKDKKGKKKKPTSDDDMEELDIEDI